jgi:hypothetical protein
MAFNPPTRLAGTLQKRKKHHTPQKDPVQLSARCQDRHLASSFLQRLATYRSLETKTAESGQEALFFFFKGGTSGHTISNA